MGVTAESRHLAGALRSGDARVVGITSRFRRYGAKCLQAAVVAGTSAGLRRRVLHALERACSNHDGSGCVGSIRELRNFEAVREVLAAEHVFAYVYEAKSAEALFRGCIQGRWELGAEGGLCVGNLVWLQAERHVVRLMIDDDAGLSGNCWSRSGAVAPWYRYVVGAPKKKGQRGGNKTGGGGRFGEKVGLERAGDATNTEASGVANVDARVAETDLVVDDSVRAGATIVEAPRTRRIRGLDTSSEEAEKQPVASNSLVSNGGDGDGGGATAVKPQRTRRIRGLDTSSEEAEKAPKRGRVKIRGLDSSSENGVGEKPAGSLRRRPPRRAAGERAMCGPEEAKEYQPVVKGMGKAKDTDQDKDLGKDEDKAKDPSKDTDLDRFLNSRSPR